MQYSCPICKKSQRLVGNEILCGECKEEFDDVKEKVDFNTRVNDTARDNINHIFALSRDEGDKVKLDSFGGVVPVPSEESTKSLAIQLTKLKGMNMILRRELIMKSAEKNKVHINKIADSIAETERLLNDKEALIDESKRLMTAQFRESSRQFDRSIDDYLQNRIKQIDRQAVKLQYKHYMVLREIALSRKDLLFEQPILKLDKFLGYSIIYINQFLENLIVLQGHLADLFKMELPFLAELEGFLPDSDFYSMIKEKEDHLTGAEDDAEEEPKPAEPEVNTNDIERVIKLGDRIQLPLSSKTINNQRRASFLKPERPSVEPDPSQRRSILPYKAGLGKKLIIVPHKILTKPFNKLNVRDFLKFLLIVVKILSNFKSFFWQLKINDDYRGSKDDFARILDQLYNLPLYFEARLEKLSAAADVASDDTTDPPQEKPELKLVMENVYKAIMNVNNEPTGSSPVTPSLLKDLNLSDLIANQTKLHLDDWDIVSKIY